MQILIGCSDGEAGEANRLTIAAPEDQGPINIFVGASDPLTYLVYDKLLAPSPYVDEPQPWLAESVESPGFGIVHKCSFLPEEVRNEANAVAEEIE